MQQGVSLCDQIVPLDAKSAPMMGSTDVGDVSWVVPTVQARGATYAIGTPGHSWQLTAQGKLPAAHKGLVHVAKVMAGTAIDVIQDEVLLARAKADHQARVGAQSVCVPAAGRSGAAGEDVGLTPAVLASEAKQGLPWRSGDSPGAPLGTIRFGCFGLAGTDRAHHPGGIVTGEGGQDAAAD